MNSDMNEQSRPIDHDIIVAGGGYVGLSLALAVKKAAPHLDIAVVDRAPAESGTGDSRAFAIAAAARRMLEAIGVWAEIEPSAQPITQMIVTDSRVSDVVRPVFLTFGGDQVAGGEPFAHMVPNATLTASLRSAADRHGVVLKYATSVEDFACETAGATVRLSSGEEQAVRLLVACDGVRSKLRQIAGIRTVEWSYDQMGIVATVTHERPHDGVAQEHFLPGGPFAILPLTGNRSSLVWTEGTRTAERLMAMETARLGDELERRFGHKLGDVKLQDTPRAFPLGLVLARETVRSRFALAGDAAHGIHPIAGQGLNLGFKDAAALAQVIVEADRYGEDIGALDVLERYQMWRRFDTVQMGVVTDVLNRLFSNDIPLVRAARDFGLAVVDRLPGLKNRFIESAAGLSPDMPNLMRGEPI